MMDSTPYDRLETAAERVARRAQASTARMSYELANRLSLLWIHGLVAATAGIQMALYGTATQIEHVLGTYSRYGMAALASIGGWALIVGLTRRPRSIILEAIGLAFVGAWDFCMAAVLAYARWSQHDYRPLSPHQPLPEGYVSAYPLSVYGGLFALIVVHLWTLRLLRKSGWTPNAKSS